MHEAWPSASSKVWKGQWRTHLRFFFWCGEHPVKLKYNAWNSWWVITFTRQFDIALHWKFKMVTQRSMSNYSKTLCSEYSYKATTWCRQFSCSQGVAACHNLTLTEFKSLERSKGNVELIYDFDVEIIPVKLPNNACNI